MYGRKVKLRFFFVLTILITLVLSTFFILKSLEENVVYFQTPSDIKILSELEKKKIRVGGMVKKESIFFETAQLKFIITDLKNEILEITPSSIHQRTSFVVGSKKMVDKLLSFCN